MSLCLDPHPLTSEVRCLLDSGHGGDHAFDRDAPGTAVWRDGERAWRYRPYASREQFERTHAIEGEPAS